MLFKLPKCKAVSSMRYTPSELKHYLDKLGLDFIIEPDSNLMEDWEVLRIKDKFDFRDWNKVYSCVVKKKYEEKEGVTTYEIPNIGVVKITFNKFKTRKLVVMKSYELFIETVKKEVSMGRTKTGYLANKEYMQKFNK